MSEAGKSNYEQMKRQMQAHFLDFDQHEMIRRFSLKYDEAFLFMDFFARPYRINRHSGLVEWSENGFERLPEWQDAVARYLKEITW